MAKLISIFLVLLMAVVALPAAAQELDIPGICEIVPQLCDLEVSPSPEPSVEPTNDPTTPGDESSTQNTNCADLDSLTEEQALGDCGVSKVTPTPTVAPEATPTPSTTPVVEEVDEPVIPEAPPATGLGGR